MDDVSARAPARTRTGRLLRQLDVHLLEVETALLGTGPVTASARASLTQARAVLDELAGRGFDVSKLVPTPQRR